MAVNLTRKTVVEAVTETTSGYVPIGNSLIDFSHWTPGTMPPSGYNIRGASHENAMIIGTGPFGSARTLWSSPGNDSDNSADGGWDGLPFPVDPDETYRFSVWVNRVEGKGTETVVIDGVSTVLDAGNFYLGLYAVNAAGGNVPVYTNRFSDSSASQSLDGNRYWEVTTDWNDKSFGPALNKWYLVVGHVHPHGSTSYTDHADSGWYQAGSTSKLVALTRGDMRWVDALSVQARHRSYLFYSTYGSYFPVVQNWAMPRVDLIDGTEPSISDLVNNTDTNQNTPLASSPTAIYGDGASVWQADTTMVDMPALTASLSPQKQLAGRSLSNVSLQTCLQQDTSATATDANTTPDIDTLLIACGMTRSIVNADPTGKRVSYVPTDTMNDDGSDVRSATVRSYHNGISTTSTGTYLNAEFNFTAGQAATVQFTGQGLYNDPVSSVFPTASAAADTRKLVESEQLSIRASNDTSPYANIIPVCRSLTWNTGNTIIERPDVNSNDGLKLLRIVSRAPTLNLVIEADTIYPSSFPAGGSTATTGPFFSELKENAHHEIRFTHQTVPSDVNAYFRFLDCQLTSVNLSDDGGVRVYNLSYSLQMAADYAYPYYFAFYNYGA